MRALVGILVTALLLGCTSTQGRPTEVAPPEVTPVYRYINLYGGERIYLGEPLEVDANHVGRSTYSLRPGTFGGGGTLAILVRLNAQRDVEALIFIYSGSESYETKVLSYTESLGEPAEVHSEPDGSRLHVWQDERTRFELHQKPGAQVEFWSILLDRDGESEGAGVRAGR